MLLLLSNLAPLSDPVVLSCIQDMVLFSLSTLSDSELIEACLRGNRQAWEALLSRYQRLIYTIPLRYGLTEEDAADIAQTVSLLLFQNLDRLRDRERLGAWLLVTTRRECWRLMRQRRRAGEQLREYQWLEEQLPLEGTAQAEGELLRLERQEVLRSAVEQLENRCRDLLLLLFYTDPAPSYEMIARRLKMPAGSIGPNRARCLAKLAAVLRRMRFFE